MKSLTRFITKLLIIGVLATTILVLRVEAQTPSPTPTPPPVYLFPGFPNSATLQGKDLGSVNTVLVFFDLNEIPQNAVITSSILYFEQINTSNGILKIINQQTGEIIDSLSLKTAGTISTNRVDTTIAEWITDPGTNYGLTFNAENLAPKDQVRLNNIHLDVKYEIPDSDKPEILELSATTTSETSALIEWVVSEPVVGYVKYGKTSKYDQYTEQTAEAKTEDSVLLESLIPNTTYHFKLLVKDVAKNQAASPNNTFVTIKKETIENTIISLTNPVQAPRALNLELVKDGVGYRVDLSWTRQDQTEAEGYILYRSVNQEDFTEYSRLSVETNRFSDLNVDSGRTYNYYVVSYRDNEISEKSPTKSVELPDFSAGVLGISDILVGNSGIDSLLIIGGIGAILGAIVYFIIRGIRNKIRLNKLKKGRRLKNVFYDPEYYLNDYEKSVLD